MCSIILITEKDSFLIATNRDELLDRVSEGPEIRQGKILKNFSPRDSLKGGTWLGLNEKGLFVGITNRFVPQTNKDLRSRGEIPVLALDCSTPSEAVSKISLLKAQDYNPFHLILADINEALVFWSDGHHFHTENLKNGFHIITESSFGAGENLRASYFEKRLGQLSMSSPIQSFKKLLAEKAEPSFCGPCISIPEKNYGTRSSLIIKMTPKENEFHYSNTPPDKPHWVDFKCLVVENFKL
ncbi:MAG: NRDE family protein [Bdellovibrionota bacterium]|nr:NRDE family protein [Bdellovibrionota bacterium]